MSGGEALYQLYFYDHILNEICFESFLTAFRTIEPCPKYKSDAHT